MNKISRVGEKYPTREGDEVEIIEYFSSNSVTLKFKNGTITKNNQFSPVKRGTVKNPNTPSACSVGYMGQGIFKSKDNNKVVVAHQTWINMLKRCYSEAYQIKYPSYIGVVVCESWKCYQNFAKWYYENYVNGWHLDKDILCKECRIYSPKTCCFVPHKINTLITNNKKDRGDLPIGVTIKGDKYISQSRQSSKKTINLGAFDTPERAFQVYKEAKEKYIKNVTEKYKENLSPNVYKILINYIVKITD